MACSCNCRSCPNLITATSVATTAGVTTITVPATFSPESFNTYCILIRTPITETSTYNSVVVTNGTDTWDCLICNGNNWRPRQIRGRTILKLRYYSDPAHFVIKQVKR